MQKNKCLSFSKHFNLLDGRVCEFIDEYDFDKIPNVLFNDAKENASDWKVDWRSDIRIENGSFNLILPSHYDVLKYENNSYCNADTGYNAVHDVDFDVDPVYENDDKCIISFKDVVLPWIIEKEKEKIYD